MDIKSTKLEILYEGLKKKYVMQRKNQNYYQCLLILDELQDLAYPNINEIIERRSKVYFFWGKKNIEQNNLKDALQNFSVCINLEPNKACPYYESGNAYLLLQDFAYAKSMWLQAHLMKPTIKKYQECVEWINKKMNNFND